MWLDRFSGHSTPSATPPASRPYSPAPPRRPSHLAPSTAQQRPGFSPRSSSLSLVSNDSSISLLPSSKRSNGSALKQYTATGEAQNPLKVLQRLLGAGEGGQSTPPTQAEDANGELEDEGELDFGGLTLKEVIALGESGATAADTSLSAEDCMLSRKYCARIMLILRCRSERKGEIRRSAQIDSGVRRGAQLS